MQQLKDVTALTELRNDVAVVGTEVNIMTTHDVRVRHFPEDTGFTLEQAFGYFAADIADSHLFDGNYPLTVDLGAPVDPTETALTHLFLQVEDILIDLLQQLHRFYSTRFHTPAPLPLIIIDITTASHSFRFK